MSTGSSSSSPRTEEDVGDGMQHFRFLQEQIDTRLRTFENYFKLFGWEEMADEHYGGVKNQCEELMSSLKVEFEGSGSMGRTSNIASIVEKVTEAIRRMDESCENLRALKQEMFPPLAIPDRGSLDKQLVVVNVFDLPEAKVVMSGRLPFRRAHFATANHQGKLYIVGGARDGQWLDTMTIYDPVRDVKTEGPRMRSTRTRPSAGFHKGKLFVAGGYNGRHLKSVECYDPESHEWTECPDLQVCRADAAVVSLNGQLFVLGGFNWKDYEKSVERLNETEQRFETVGRMEDGRAGFGACAFDGRIYVAGGWMESFQTLNTAKSYDPQANAWRDEPTMIRKRKYFTLHAGSQAVFAIGGNSDDWTQIREIEKLSRRVSAKWEVCWKEPMPTLGSAD